MDLTTLDIKDLKALAYDTLAQIERHQHNLRVINQEITKRADAMPASTQEELNA